VGWNHRAAAAGYKLGAALGNGHSLAGITPAPAPRLLISGHEALALGALAAGLQFISGYPMTPWSSVLNAVGQRAARWGVVVEQAEDEIAAINLALGASFAGVRAMTGSSGGGFSLMVETLGLAGCSETPLVIVEAQRPGPSTGLPTRTEQGDLSFVLHAGQGDFPRAVLAPGTPAQGFALTAMAFNLADRYQLPVIVITDQYFGDTNFTQEPGDFPTEVEIERALATGIFASTAINAAGPNGALYGNPYLLAVQAFAVVVVAAFAFFGSYFLLKVINFITPVRVSPEEEETGLDISQHGEEAYGER
jgi:2-oxoglutarate ferredoxin oxidoreductase subunit alpha